MTGRRCLLAGLLAMAAMPAEAASRDRRARRRRRAPAQPEEPAAEITRIQPAAPDRGTNAPVPNRSLEAPRTSSEAQTQIEPSIIYRRMPGRSATNETSPGVLEDQLFKPVPGVRLNAPFSY